MMSIDFSASCHLTADARLFRFFPSPPPPDVGCLSFLFFLFACLLRIWRTLSSRFVSDNASRSGAKKRPTTHPIFVFFFNDLSGSFARGQSKGEPDFTVHPVRLAPRDEPPKRKNEKAEIRLTICQAIVLFFSPRCCAVLRLPPIVFDHFSVFLFSCFWAAAAFLEPVFSPRLPSSSSRFISHSVSLRQGPRFITPPPTFLSRRRRSKEGLSRIGRIRRRNGAQSRGADSGRRRRVRKEMQAWIPLTLAAAAAVVVLAVVVVAVAVYACRRRGSKESGREQLVTRAMTADSLHDAIAKLHQTSLQHQLDREGRRRPGYYAFRRGASTRPLFSWADHPALVTDAVESGWSRFAFAGYKSSPSTRSMLLGACATAGDHRSGIQPEINWEVCPGSADFMQKIRLNPGLLKKISLSNSNPMAASSVIKTALPLPGPPLGNSSFPQEAYFEITVLYSGSDVRDPRKSQEGERTKLIHDSSNLNANSESLAHVTSHGHGNNYGVEELKLNVKDGGKIEPVDVSLGLTAGGSLPLKLPGSYPGSIGFNSNGSVFLDGIRLVFESEKAEWGRTEKVIGCGFDPRQKKVFFTVDSELMHEIHCKTEEYGAPLYPTLAANSDVMVLVNFGQAAFRYGPANTQRTSNPCFIGPLTNSPAAALGYEDSKELFSMGRIDSQWLNQFMSRGSHNHGNNNSRVRDFDDESEADLFEIALDSSGRSPNTVL